VKGRPDDLAWDVGLPPFDPRAALTCERSNAVLATTTLSASPEGRHGDPEMDEPLTVRWVVLHMVEETAAHSGHLEIARELLDGEVGRGQR
jgi:hypothetical protein